MRIRKYNVLRGSEGHHSEHLIKDLVRSPACDTVLRDLSKGVGLSGSWLVSVWKQAALGFPEPPGCFCGYRPNCPLLFALFFPVGGVGGWRKAACGSLIDSEHPIGMLEAGPPHRSQSRHSRPVCEGARRLLDSRPAVLCFGSPNGKVVHCNVSDLVT